MNSLLQLCKIIMGKTSIFASISKKALIALSIFNLLSCSTASVDRERLRLLSEFDNTPLWRVQLAIKICDQKSAKAREFFYANVDLKTAGAWSSAALGVGLYLPDQTMSRNSVAVYDLGLDTNANINSVGDLAQIVLSTKQDNSVCIDWIKLLVNNPHPIEIEANDLSGNAADFVVYSKSWDGGNWLQATTEKLIYNSCEGQDAWLNLDRNETDPNKTRFPGANPPPGFVISGTDGSGIYAEGLIDECRASFPLAQGYFSFRLATKAEFVLSPEWLAAAENRSLFNNVTGAIRIRPILRDFVTAVIGDLMTQPALAKARWGEKEGSDWVSFRKTDDDLQRIRVDLDLNRAGRNNTAWNRLDVDFDLVVSCNGPNLQFDVENVDINFTAVARVFSLGLLKKVGKIAEKLARRQLRPIPLNTDTCGNPRFQGALLYLI